jgi:hypothetical protein
MNNQVLMKADVQAPVAETVERCVELLCQQGCPRVNESIGALQSGQPVVGIEALDKPGRDVLLEELVSIMAVYQCSCADG